MAMDASEAVNTADVFDAHCHLQDVRLLPVVTEVVRDSVLRHVRFLATNGTSESDWDLVTNVFQEHADCVIPSYGVHPWCGMAGRHIAQQCQSALDISCDSIHCLTASFRRASLLFVE